MEVVDHRSDRLQIRNPSNDLHYDTGAEVSVFYSSFCNNLDHRNCLQYAESWCTYRRAEAEL